MGLKMKRILFIFILICIFIGCIWKMNQEYDELARYPYELTEEQRALILQYLDSTQINDLVTQKIEPDQFLPYIEVEGFDLDNTLWYDTAYHIREDDKAYIVSFINKYRDYMNYAQLSDLLTNYSYNELTRFFDEKDAYLDDAVLATNITQYKVLAANETLYTYEPDNLVTINDLPHNSAITQNDIMIREDVVEPLRELMEAATSQEALKDLKITSAYISYESQVTLYEEAYAEYKDDVQLYADYPGRNEAQLGYTVCLQIDLDDEESEDEEDSTTQLSEEEQEQVIWLKDNAYKYGFVIRYPKNKEEITNKKYQPFTLRYVGVELAKYMHDENLTLEEISDDILESYLS